MCAWPTFIYSSSELNFLQKFYFMAITSSQSMPFRLLRELAQHIIPGRYLCRHSWDTSIRVHDKLSLHSLSQHTVKLWPINLVVSFPPISYGDRDPSLQLLLPKAPLSLSSSTGGIFRQEDHKRCQVIYNLLQIMVHNNVHKYPQRLAAVPVQETSCRMAPPSSLLVCCRALGSDHRHLHLLVRWRGGETL